MSERIEQDSSRGRSFGLPPLLAAAVLAAIAATWTSPVRAGDDLDVTMTVIEGNDPNIEHEVTKHIALPPRPQRGGEAARSGDAPGRGVADEARERGRDFGQSTADEARGRRGPPADRPGNGSNSGKPGKPDQPGKP